MMTTAGNGPGPSGLTILKGMSKVAAGANDGDVKRGATSAQPPRNAADRKIAFLRFTGCLSVFPCKWALQKSMIRIDKVNQLNNS
jgi:hypothetical protein